MCAFLILALAACANETAMSHTDGSSPAATDSTASDTSDGYAPSTASTTLPVAPTWWTVDGALSVLAGEVDPARSSITVTLYDDALAPLCTETAAPATVTPSASPDPSLEPYGWWAVNLPPTGPCDLGNVRALALGFGATDPSLYAPANHAGYDAGTYDAFWLAWPGGVWIAGVALPPDAADTGAGSTSLLVDGTWIFASVVYLPWTTTSEPTP